jgi:hypothetical protein
MSAAFRGKQVGELRIPVGATLKIVHDVKVRTNDTVVEAKRVNVSHGKSGGLQCPAYTHFTLDRMCTRK